MDTLGARLADHDEARFVGRDDVLARLARVLEEDSEVSVVFLHGRGGIGKSALLRETARRAIRCGYLIRWIDGREPAAMASQIGDALAAHSSAPLVVVVDTYERVAGVGAHLRGHVLPYLPATTRVLVAGRHPPEDGWHQGGWETITDTIAVGPLSEEESREVLNRMGVAHTDTVAGILRWARGEPLALVVAAQAVTVDPGLGWSDTADGSDLAEILARRLVGEQALTPADDLLAVASIAHAVDARLLDEVLEGVDGTSAHRRLRNLPFAEVLDDRVTLHDRVRTAVHQRLRRTNPSRERDLRRRLVDHFAQRAHQGDIRYLEEMGALLENPDLRRAWAADGLGVYQTDQVRPGDEAVAARALDAEGTAWWEGVRRWFTDAPHCITTVRDTTGTLTGFCIAMSRTNAPPWCHDDPVVAPRMADAAVRYPDREVVVWRDAFGFPTDPSADPVEPNMAATKAAILRVGSPELEVVYGSAVTGDPVSTGIADAWEAEPLPGLRVVDGERVVEGRIREYPGGLIDATRALVYRELGLEPPSPEQPPTVDTVRKAFRTLHDPDALAASPLAHGTSPTESADSVRRILTTAVDEAFTDSPDDQLLRGILELGYIDPTLTHEAAARRLHLARSTYYSRLTRALERVTKHLNRLETR